MSEHKEWKILKEKNIKTKKALCIYNNNTPASNKFSFDTESENSTYNQQYVANGILGTVFKLHQPKGASKF